MSILNSFPIEIILPKDEKELETLVMNVAFLSQQQTAVHCASICDSNRGMLSVGDVIRGKYSIDLTSKEENNTIKKEVKSNHLSRVK